MQFTNAYLTIKQYKKNYIEYETYEGKRPMGHTAHRNFHTVFFSHTSTAFYTKIRNSNIYKEYV